MGSSDRARAPQRPHGAEASSTGGIARRFGGAAARGCRWLTDRLRADPWLVLVVLVAAAARLSVIGWGLPIGFGRPFHPDEPKYLGPAMFFREFYLTGKPFPLYGTSLQYTVGLFLTPIHMVMKWVGVNFLYNVVSRVVCRLTVIALGTLSVLLVHRLGTRLFDRRAGLIGAAFLSVSLFHALNSALFTVDVPMSALLLVNLLLCLRIQERDTLASYGLLGGVTGYLIGTKVTALVFVAVPATLILLGAWPTRDRSRLVKGLLVSAAAAAITFVVLSPQFVFDLGEVYEQGMQDKVDFVDRTAPREMSRVVIKALQGFTIGLGWPVALLAVPGVVCSGRRHWRFKVSLLVMIGLYALLLRHFMLPRYVVFIAPIVCLFAGRTCALLFERGRRGRAIAGLLVAVTLGLSTTHLAVAIEARIRDPRIAAARYLHDEYPGPTRIAFSLVSEEFAGSHRWRYPALRRRGHQMVGLFEAPDVVVTSSFDMRKIEAALRSGLLSEDFEFDPADNFRWYRYSAPSPRVFRFYDALLAGRGEYRLVRVFEAGRRLGEFPPPEIRVYERRRLDFAAAEQAESVVVGGRG